MSHEPVLKDRNNKDLEQPSDHVKARSIPMIVLFWVGIILVFFLFYKAFSH